MSGTSADGIDAALVEWPDGPTTMPFELVAFREIPLGDALQAQVHDLAAGRLAEGTGLADLVELDVRLGERFAEAALAIVAEAGRSIDEIDAIASHGQTVAHHPERRATLQIGDPSVIAERTGCTVVADFRTRDVAAGGQGAPLAPFFHHAVLASDSEARLVLNLGGIANVTWLPRAAAPGDVVAFDVGPANSLLDGVMTTWSGGEQRFDRDGVGAAAGEVDAALLAELLDDPFLRKPPPKSTGRERYGIAEAEGLVARWRAERRELADLLATLVAFSAEAVVAATRDHLEGARVERILVGGGGARNPVLMRTLSDRAGVPVEPVDAAGIPAAAMEAMAFSLMGRNALLGLPNHLPRTTGARGLRVLGEIVPAADGRIAPRL